VTNKSRIPGTKYQTNTKFQKANSKQFMIWNFPHYA